MLKCIGQWCPIMMMAVTLTALSLGTAMPSTVTPPSSTDTAATARSSNTSSIIEPTFKLLANQLTSVNASTQITFDTRTPPKFREQVRKGDAHQQPTEFGHPGVAEAVDDEGLMLEEEQKKMHFYKVDKPTTSSGISTWILLSGQASTNKPPKKLPTAGKNSTSSEEKVVKPIFKRKTTIVGTTSPSGSSTTPLLITKRPTILVASTATATEGITTLPTEKIEKTTKLTKIASNTSKKVSSRLTTSKPTKTSIGLSSTTTPSATTTTSSNSTTPGKQELVKVPTQNSNSSELQMEAKEGVLDLSPSTIDKKTKRPTTLIKRKKNKNRKKKPVAQEKIDLLNGTKVSNKIKEKPFGTQIYNYLSREVMPTVGVGLVGLMVTAGLASYFLYPFGALRRSFEVDRKDKDSSYYYTDEYSGGISEEEAIGKVIAGMPAGNYFNTNARVHNSRNTYGLSDVNFHNMIGSHGDSYHPTRYRNIDQRYTKGSAESLPLQTSYPNVKTHGYRNHKDNIELYATSESPELLPANEPQLAVTTEYTATPAVVPEHGPRAIEEENLAAAAKQSQDNVFIVESIPAQPEALHSLEHGPRRRRRQVQRRQFEKDIDNEILEVSKVTSGFKESSSTLRTTSTTLVSEEESYTTAYPIMEKSDSIFNLIRDLIYLKLRYGLELLQNKAESLSRYFRTIQDRVDAIHAYHSNVNQTISYS